MGIIGPFGIRRKVVALTGSGDDVKEQDDRREDGEVCDHICMHR